MTAMSNGQLVQIMQEQHAIRAARFQTGPRRNEAMEQNVREMLHLNDYLADQGFE